MLVLVLGGTAAAANATTTFVAVTSRTVAPGRCIRKNTVDRLVYSNPCRFIPLRSFVAIACVTAIVVVVATLI